MMTTFYGIFYKVDNRKDNWRRLDDIEYTKKEADRELRNLKGAHSIFIFRKEKLFTADVCTATATLPLVVWE